jgi:dihydrofolate synthase / folylpolyglutamate synthase
MQRSPDDAAPADVAELAAPAPGVTTLGEYAGRTGAILARVHALYPTLIDLSLGRLERLLAALGHPERHLPPVVHVAGTNGKGSTCAAVRAIAEAAGWRAHVMTSPHLVSLLERFRIAGRLVDEDALVAVLEEIEAANAGAAITVFEVLTAAGLVLFARTPAEIAIVEVGLGGRFDATNVVPHPAVSVISRIGLDHQAFLGDTLAAIAGEKAGIIKPGAPVVSAAQAPEAADVIAAKAEAVGSVLWLGGRDWTIEAAGNGTLRYSDPLGTLVLPMPSLSGPHQVDNAGLAVAALRASGLAVPDAAWSGIARASWPARMQRLHGVLADQVPGCELWLDGGHNPDAGVALGAVIDGWAEADRAAGREPEPVHVIVGMKQTKDVAGFLRPLLARASSVQAVAEPGQHLAIPVEEVVAASGGQAVAGPVIATALERIRTGAPGRVLICGSLYLAGVALAQDGYVPV